jgi:hypothetical protein
VINRDTLAFFYSGKYSGEYPQAAGVQPTNGSMVYLGGEQLDTGAAHRIISAARSSLLIFVAAATLVAVVLL